MIKSVNQLRLELEEIQQNHLQLNSFYWGDFLVAYKQNRLNYPLMGSFYPSGSFKKQGSQILLTIYVADKLYKDWSNLNEIESDTLQAIRDIYRIINQSTRWQNFGKVVGDPVITKFVNRGGDEVAGHQMQLNFLMRSRSGVCGLPMSDNYDFDQIVGEVCFPVSIYENGVLVASIAAGGSYSYIHDDAHYIIKDGDGNILYQGDIIEGGTLDQTISDSTAVLKNTANNTLSTTSILAEGSEDIVAPDATVENSDASYTDTVASGGTLVLPDTTFDIYVNGVFNTTFTQPTLGTNTINITN